MKKLEQEMKTLSGLQQSRKGRKNCGMVKWGIVREKKHFNLRKYHHNPYVASNATQKISKRYKNYGMVKWGIVREKKIISI